MLACDMSELVSDPEFLTSITRLRPTTVLVPGTEGESSATYVSTDLMAIVQPTGRPDQMDPQPEGERMDSWILILSATSILMAGPESVSDIVRWGGGSEHPQGTFRVMKVEDYSNCGYFVAYAQEYHAATPTQPDPEEGGP